MVGYLISQAFWLLLAPGIGNMTPPLVAKLWPSWSAHVDLGYSIGGRRIFGDNKTIRGFISGVLAASLMFKIQVALGFTPEILAGHSQSLWLGSALGFAALLGDLIKSFFKRRVGVPPGRSWFPLDQIDWILGVLLFLSLITSIETGLIVICLIEGLALSLFIKVLGYCLRINETYF